MQRQTTIGDFFARPTQPTTQQPMPAAHPVPVVQPRVVCKKRSYEVAFTPALEAYFVAPPMKRARALKYVTDQLAHVPTPHIGIAHRSDGDGRGAQFDHRTIQLATDAPTAILNADAMPRGLEKNIREMGSYLKFGEKIDNTDFKFPPILRADDPRLGLIIYTGVSATEYQTSAYQARAVAEQALQKTNELEGRPFAMICGGVWPYATAKGASVVAVEGHNYRGGMPRLSKVDATPCNNKEMHALELKEEGRLFRGSLGKGYSSNQPLTVNSVHGLAVDADTLPESLVVAAVAVSDASLAPSNGKEAEKSVEAIETKHGAPVLGYQFHPEAYRRNELISQSLQYMSEAGKAFNARKAMVESFKQMYPEKIKALNKTECLAYNLTTIKRQHGDVVSFSIFRLKKTKQLRHVDELKYEIAAKENYLREKLSR